MRPHNAVEVLARLLQGAELRRRFRSNREGVIRQFGVPADQEQMLRKLDDDELDSQAMALVRKRASEVAGLIPMTWKRLGTEAELIFERYVDASAWPTGHRKHLFDATAFCEYLSRSGSMRMRPKGGIRGERQWVRFLAGPSRFWVGLDPRMIVKNQQRMGLLLFVRWRGNPFQFSAHFPTFSFDRFK